MTKERCAYELVINGQEQIQYYHLDCCHIPQGFQGGWWGQDPQDGLGTWLTNVHHYHSIHRDQGCSSEHIPPWRYVWLGLDPLEQAWSQLAWRLGQGLQVYVGLGQEKMRHGTGQG